MLGWVLLAGAAPPLDAAPARPQPLSDIVAVVEDACRREAGHRGYDTVSVTVRSLDRRLNLPQCSQALVSFPVQAQQVLACPAQENTPATKRVCRRAGRGYCHRSPRPRAAPSQNPSGATGRDSRSLFSGPD